MTTEPGGIESAFVLAAGRGERLRPLTDTTCKPLMPIGTKPILDHVLEALAVLVKPFGLKRVVINGWHLKDQIEAFVKDRSRRRLYPFEVLFSPESELLGTGGGLKRAAELLRTAGPLLMMNGDVLFEGDLAGFCERALADRRAEGSWWLAPEQKDQTQIFVEGRRVRRIGSLWRADITASGLESAQKGCFSGVQVFRKLAVEGLPAKGCIIRDYWVKRLEAGALLAGDFEGLNRWVDIGTLERYALVRDGF